MLYERRDHCGLVLQVGVRRHLRCQSDRSTAKDNRARDLCATNYLEETGGGNNAQTGGPFIQARPSASFNDRLLIITAADLMPVVEQRVAREMISILERYRTATGSYPWAALSDGNSSVGNNRGRFPCGVALPIPWFTVVDPLIPTSTPDLPAWLTNGCGSNGWASVIYYTAAQELVAGLCTTCTDTTLSVNSNAGTNLVLLTPGAASITPRGAWPSSYFVNPENNDNVNDSYVTPTSTGYNRNRLFR